MALTGAREAHLAWFAGVFGARPLTPGVGDLYLLSLAGAFDEPFVN
jgi:hypothetical protein